MPTPAERAAAIKAGTEKARKNFLAYTDAQEKAIYDLLQQSAENIAARIAKAEALGKIPPARLRPLLDSIKAEMAALRPAIKGQIVRGMSNSVNLGMQAASIGMAGADIAGVKTGIGTAFIGKDGKLRRYDAKEEAYKDSKWGRINKGAMTALIKFQPGGITLSDRVWDMTWSAEKAIRNRLQMAVLQGDSAARLSRDIRGLLSQPLTLRGGVKAAYHPGVGVYKSAYQNGMRFARTEYNRAFNEGIFRYANDKEWVTGYIWRTGSAEPCPDCEDLDGTEYAKGDEPDIPLHPNCVIGETPIIAPGIMRGIVADYSGSVIEVFFADNRTVTVTPNHMFLTPHGFIHAKHLRKGDNIFYSPIIERAVFSDPNHDGSPPTIKQIIETLAKSKGVTSSRMPVSPEYLHGDGQFVKSNIHIISSNRFLKSNILEKFTQFIRNHSLTGFNSKLFQFAGSRNLTTMLFALRDATDGGMGVRRGSKFFSRRLFTVPKSLGVARNTRGNTRPEQSFSDGSPATMEEARKEKFRISQAISAANFSRIKRNASIQPNCFHKYPQLIELTKVNSVKVEQFKGKVYDLQTTSTLYIANGLLSSNCMCYLELTTDETK